MDDDKGGRGRSYLLEKYEREIRKAGLGTLPRRNGKSNDGGYTDRTGENTILKEKEEGVASHEVFGIRCGGCGDKAHKRERCHREVKCEWCGKEGHVAGVCWQRLVHCGGKAQHGKECTVDRRTRKYVLLNR
jgi:hypothetical protein